MKHCRDLVVWQRVVDLVAEVYTVTRGFPREEQFGLVAQMRRAAVSIPSNIAEGQGRLSQGEFAQFLATAEDLCASCRLRFSYQNPSASSDPQTRRG